MFDLTIDHYTIKVNDLKQSADFYSNVLGLSKITNRTEKSYIRWFSLGNGSELHVVEGDTSKIETPIGVHLALRMSDFDGFINHLKSHNITPHDSKGNPDNTTTRADGVRQVYFPDPDGYWIEVNEAVAE